MISRLHVDWPDSRPFMGRHGSPIRFLAASDEVDPALEHAANRTALGPIDGIIGCGDLEPSWLNFLADAFGAPVVYVRGNHDRGPAWVVGPEPVPAWLVTGHTCRMSGIPISGLEWPGVDEAGNRRRPSLAWRHVLGLAARTLVGRVVGNGEPMVVISHAPPRGAGDVPTDPYHVGFGAYRWLIERLHPPIWLHGHTTTASVPALVTRVGRTTVVNVTGAVLIDLWAPGALDPSVGKGTAKPGPGQAQQPPPRR